MNEKCFAMRGRNVCGLLYVKGCLGYRRCAFYKPIWMYYRDRDRVNTRLRGMSEVSQQHFSEKYHHGSRPWRGARK